MWLKVISLLKNKHLRSPAVNINELWQTLMQLVKILKRSFAVRGITQLTAYNQNNSATVIGIMKRHTVTLSVILSPVLITTAPYVNFTRLF
jgi:hypothetical protein